LTGSRSQPWQLVEQGRLTRLWTKPAAPIIDPTPSARRVSGFPTGPFDSKGAPQLAAGRKADHACAICCPGTHPGFQLNPAFWDPPMSACYNKARPRVGPTPHCAPAPLMVSKRARHAENGRPLRGRQPSQCRAGLVRDPPATKKAWMRYFQRNTSHGFRFGMNDQNWISPNNQKAALRRQAVCMCGIAHGSLLPAGLSKKLTHSTTFFRRSGIYSTTDAAGFISTLPAAGAAPMAAAFAVKGRANPAAGSASPRIRMNQNRNLEIGPWNSEPTESCLPPNADGRLFFQGVGSMGPSAHDQWLRPLPNCPRSGPSVTCAGLFIPITWIDPRDEDRRRDPGHDAYPGRPLRRTTSRA